MRHRNEEQPGGSAGARVAGAVLAGPAGGGVARAETVGGSPAALPDTVIPGAGEPVHVEGAAAAAFVQPRLPPLETVAFTGGTDVLLLDATVPADSNPGGAAIEVLSLGEALSPIASLSPPELVQGAAGTPATASDSGAATGPLQAQLVDLAEPASVEGGMVTIGAATVLLTDYASVPAAT